MPIVVDTNVFIGACLSAGSPSRVIELCVAGILKPVMGIKLYNEYEDVLARDDLFERARLNAAERDILFDAFADECLWHDIYFLWRPNLPDDADNHIMELAVAAGATHIVTSNIRDFRNANLRFEHIAVVTPDMFLRELDQ